MRAREAAVKAVSLPEKNADRISKATMAATLSQSSGVISG